MSDVIGYIRVSTDTRQEASVELQQERLKAYCVMRGLTLVDAVVDEGVSGGTPFARRAGGKRVLEILKGKSVTGIVSLKLDRMFRSTYDALGKIEEWERRHIALHILDLGGTAVDTTSAAGKFFVTMLAGVAEFERTIIGERTRNVLRFKRDHGRAYNHPPLGFDLVEDGIDQQGKMRRRMAANDVETAVLDDIFDMYRAGVTAGRIASALNRKGIPGKRGGKFYAVTIKKIIRNPLHADRDKRPTNQETGCFLISGKREIKASAQ